MGRQPPEARILKRFRHRPGRFFLAGQRMTGLTVWVSNGLGARTAAEVFALASTGMAEYKSQVDESDVAAVSYSSVPPRFCQRW